MLLKDRNIVKIDFDILKGLVLKWNFRGCLTQTYFRHILIIDIDDRSKVYDFVQKFYTKLKLGDLINIGFITKNQLFELNGWKEKNPLTQINHHKIKPIVSTLKNLTDFLSQIDSQLQDLQDPIFFSILTQRSQDQAILLQKYLMKLLEKSKNYGVNIFTNAQSSIDVSKGINWLNINDIQNENGWNFFKSYMSQIALLRVKITIQCENGSIYSQKLSQWKNVDFNKIERQLKMPTINYLQDIIEFMNQEIREKINYSLKIKLEYQELNLKSYRAQKNITLTFENLEGFQKTYTGNEFNDHFYLMSKLSVDKLQKESKTPVWFSKDIPQVSF